jgi:site-specific DNA recombinase
MWPILSYEEKIKLIDELVEEIRIQEGNLHFTLTYTPPFRKLGKGVHNLRGSWRPPA